MFKRLLANTQHVTRAPHPAVRETTGVQSRRSPCITAVLGAKGGVGATSVAVNLAAACASISVATTLVDGNLQHPDAAVLLAAESQNSLLDLLGREGELDRQLFDACSISGAAGIECLRMLSAPMHDRAGMTSSLSDLAKLLSHARQYSDLWIIDLPRHVDKHLVTLMDTCDRIVLVFEGNLSCAASVKRWLNIFADLGYSDEKIVCVLNRAGSKHASVERELCRVLGDTTIVPVPNSSSLLWDCASTGIPGVVAHPRHAFSQAIYALAQRVTRPGPDAAGIKSMVNRESMIHE